MPQLSVQINGLRVVIGNLWIDQVEECLAEAVTGVKDFVIYAARILLHEEPEVAEGIENATEVVNNIHQIRLETVILPDRSEVVRDDPLAGAPAMVCYRVKTVSKASNDEDYIEAAKDELLSAGRSEEVSSLVAEQDKIIDELRVDVGIALVKSRVVRHGGAVDESPPELDWARNSDQLSQPREGVAESKSPVNTEECEILLIVTHERHICPVL